MQRRYSANELSCGGLDVSLMNVHNPSRHYCGTGGIMILHATGNLSIGFALFRAFQSIHPWLSC